MRRLKTVRRPPIYPKTPGHLPCSSLTHPLPLSSRRPSVSFGGFGLNLVDFHGEPVAVIFWAWLCPTSKIQMRELQAVHSQSSSINVLGVDIGPFLGLGSREDGGRVASELGITYPVGSALDGTLIIDSGIVVVPTTFFMTAEGELFHRWVGRLSQRGIEGLIEDMAIAEVGWKEWTPKSE